MDYWQALTRRFRRPADGEAQENEAVTERSAAELVAGTGTIANPNLPDRRSRAWGKAAEWMNSRVPKGCAARLRRLAEGHDLHRWQVLVAALDCFEATYGRGKPGD